MQNIKNKNPIIISLHGKPVGSFLFEDKKIIFLDNFKDENILNIIKNSEKNGISYVRYVHREDEHTSLFEKSFPVDSNFFFELIKLIKNNGYEIYEEVLEINKEINELLDLLPEDNEIRKDILKNLADMNYLEKTYLKDKLKEKFDSFLELKQ